MEKRIESNVCIYFIAHKLYKELKRIIKHKEIDISVHQVHEAAKTVTNIRVKMPKNGRYLTKTMFLTEKHRTIEPLFNPETYMF